MVKKTLPSLKDLELVRNEMKNIRNRRGEFLRKVHYGCFLLCSESGLRISEAIKFDLSTKNKKGLYRISKPKGKKERLVYVSKKVISELEANHWQPNQTNRWNFYHFLRKIKRELNISKKVELTPHTFRRAFTTYHANSGMPLPLLQKLLGHSSIRTTALYWRNIYGEDDPSNILAGKNWLENKEPTKSPSTESDLSLVKTFDKDLQNFPQPKNLEPIGDKPKFIEKKPPIKPNSPPPIKIEPKLVITNYQPKSLISEISPKLPIETSEQITSQKENSTEGQFLLEKIKDLESQLRASQSLLETSQNKLAEALHSKDELKEELAKAQTENKQLKLEKEKAEAVAKSKQDRANYYEKQLKLVVKAFYQWSKINYYKRLEQEAKIEQPLPFKVRN